MKAGVKDKKSLDYPMVKTANPLVISSDALLACNGHTCCLRLTWALA